MFISKKELALREQLAAVQAENKNLRERLAAYEAVEATTRKQWDNLWGYNGEPGGGTESEG